MAKIVVTGGAGFIGSHTVEQLLAVGHTPIVVDDLSTGSKDNLPAGIAVEVMDILDPGLAAWMTKEKPAYCIHLAAQIDVQTSIDNPRHDASVNILGTLAVLQAVRAAGVKKIVYASSAAVFGEPEYLGVDEDHPVRPLSFYGISKHTPEHYIQAFSQLYDLDYTILRYANVYGPRQGRRGEGGVVSIFTQCFRDGTQPTVFGDGRQTRDFIYVKDIARANTAALDHGSRRIFNIGTGQPVSVRAIYDNLVAVSGRDPGLMYQPARSGDIVHSYFDIAASVAGLQWQPETSLPEGLATVLATDNEL